MIFRVLGCSGSELERNHPCSFLVDSTILVDMGSAASRLTLEEQARITDVMISHAHLDHTKDVPFLAENIFTRISMPVTVRSTSGTLKKLRNHILNNEIWPDFSALPSVAKAVLRYEAFDVRKPFRVQNVEIYAIPVNHPGGCVALFFNSGNGVVLYGGDSGPTDAVWEEANKFGSKLRAVLLETSFPDRLQEVADASGHHTPRTFGEEIKKIESSKVPIFVHHLKAPYLDEIKKEMRGIEDDRVSFLEPGMRIEF